MPVRETDPEGEDCPGCDDVPLVVQTPCVLECCAKHDECYDLNNCSIISWCDTAGYIPGILISPFLSSCNKCNIDVVACIAACSAGTRVANPRAPKYYCKSRHKYISIGLPSPPNDFPNVPAASAVCCG